MVKITIIDKQGKTRTFESVSDVSKLTETDRERLFSVGRGEGRGLALETTPKPNLITRVINWGKERFG